ncbi:MAG: RHS repeat domain-containing protein [Armatimonadota bacterium]
MPLGGDPEAAERHRRGLLAYVWEVVGRTVAQTTGLGETTYFGYDAAGRRSVRIDPDGRVGHVQARALGALDPQPDAGRWAAHSHPFP